MVLVLYSEASDCCCSDGRAVEEPGAGRAATHCGLCFSFFYSMVLGGNGTVNQEQNFGNFSSLLPFYTVVYSYLQLKVASETWGDVFHLEDSLCPLAVPEHLGCCQEHRRNGWKNRTEMMDLGKEGGTE